MQIAGWQKTSLIEYPEHISAIIFIWGCNFLCPYCHNPELVKKRLQPKLLPAEEIFAFLAKRKNVLEAVSITGGEPLLYPEIIDFIKRIKTLSYLVKLDTNGTNPFLLEKIIDLKLVDYIAMDIKAPLEKYEKITGVRVDLEKIKKSIKLIMNSGIKYEFRSTILPALHDQEDVMGMARLIQGAKRYYLQNFVNQGKLLDETLKNELGFKKEELVSMAKACQELVRECMIR